MNSVPRASFHACQWCWSAVPGGTRNAVKCLQLTSQPACALLQLVQSQKGGYTAWADKGFEYQILQVCTRHVLPRRSC